MRDSTHSTLKCTTLLAVMMATTILASPALGQGLTGRCALPPREAIVVVWLQAGDGIRACGPLQCSTTPTWPRPYTDEEYTEFFRSYGAIGEDDVAEVWCDRGIHIQPPEYLRRFGREFFTSGDVFRLNRPLRPNEIDARRYMPRR